MRIDNSTEIFAGQLFEILDFTRDDSAVKDAKICFADYDNATGRTFYNGFRNPRDILDLLRRGNGKATVILSIKMFDDKWYNFSFLLSATEKPKLSSTPDVGLRAKLDDVEIKLDDFCQVVNSLRHIQTTIDSTLKYV